MPANRDQKQTPNFEDWEVTAGPAQVVPWEDADVSAAWVWALRHRRTGETRELVVRTSWRGFDSIDEVPSNETKEAFAAAGRPGVDWFMQNTFDGWAEIIFHSQTRGGPHGSTGAGEILRLS